MKRAKPNHAATPIPAREMQLANIGQCQDHSGSVAIIDRLVRIFPAAADKTS